MMGIPEIQEDFMQPNIVTLTFAIFLGGASTASASETVTMNAIDANGVGKSSARFACRIPKQAYGSHQSSPICRLVTMDSMSTSTLIVVPVMARTASQPLAWQRVDIMTRRTLASISAQTARATRATCQCSPSIPAAKPRKPPRHPTSPWPTLRAARS